MITIPTIFLPAIIILFTWILQSALHSLFKNETVDEIAISIAKWTTLFCLIIYFFMILNWTVNHIQFR